jgi:plastocyanin
VSVRTKAGSCAVLAGLLLALPGVAQARTKVVAMGLPAKSAQTFQNTGSDVNDFFPHGVAINVGDSVRFVPAGFHTVDLPPKGGGALPFFIPTGQKIAGVNDAAGQPFWFNGQDQIGLNTALFAGNFGKRVKYTGRKRVNSGAPIQGGEKPMTVKFTKAGSYRYYCDIHPGMSGLVKVRPKGKSVPSRKADKRRLNSQLTRDLNIAKGLSNAKPPSGIVDVGVAGPHGEEFLGFVPNAIKVPAGTTLRFRMSPGSREAHTATTGPGNPEDPNTYLGQIAASFQSPVLDPRGAYPSEAPPSTGTLTPLLHGNGFWNSGVMDLAKASPAPESNAVTFGAPGTYQFYCLIHPFMHATVTVQ